MEYRWKNIVTFLLLVISIIVVVPWEDKPFLGDQGFVLGLDLRGGAQLTLNMDYSGQDMDQAEKHASTEKAVDILYQRIDQFGLTQPKIQKIAVDKILVQIPGVDPTRGRMDQIEKILSSTGKLEFYLQASQTQRDKAGEEGNNATAPAGTKWLKADPSKDFNLPQKWYLVESEPRVLGKHLENAEITSPPGKGFRVNLSLNSEGAERFAEATRDAQPNSPDTRVIVIALDGLVKSAPAPRSVITGGSAYIDGGKQGFEGKTAERLATILNSGTLNAPIEIAQRKSVGPSLGQASIQRGKIAIGLALVIVVLFMIAYYWSLGVIVSFVLGLNLLLLAAFLLIMQATLTLPGMAGILLTVGIAVDASVIIFERIREETKKEQSPRKAFEVGWNKAFWAVFDANITTLIAAVVLFYFGSQAIKGFATTLLLGVLTTLFTVFFSEKALIQGLMDLDVLNLDMMDLFSGSEFKFLNKAKISFVVSGLLVLGSIGVFAYGASQDGRIFGLEFTGGEMLTLQMEKPITSNTIREKLSDIQLGGNYRPYLGAELQRSYEETGEQNPNAGNSSQAKTGSSSGAGSGSCTPGSPCSFQFRLKGSKLNRLIEFYLPRDLKRIFGEDTSPEFRYTDDSVRVSFPDMDPVPLSEFQDKIHNFRYKTSYIQPYDGATISVPGGASGSSDGTNAIQIRRSNQIKQAYLRHDLITTFQESIAPPRARVLKRNPNVNFLISLQEEASLESVRQEVVSVFEEQGISQNPYVRPADQNNGEADENVSARQFVVETHPDVRSTVDENYEEILDAIDERLSLSSGPFGGLVQTIGSQVAESFKRDAFWAISLSWIAILFYLALRFEFAYGVGAVIALIHDVVLCVGIVALVDLLLPPELGINLDIGMSSFAAFLTVVGYSVNDSIVTFDRIREIIKESRNLTLGEIIDQSINLNLSRTVLTSVTTFLAAAILFFVTASSGTDVASFAFPIMVGVILGTFSSMFLASPLLIYSPLVGRSEDTPASRLKW